MPVTREKIISSVELETFCHATESSEKVERALFSLVPRELRDKLSEKLRYATLRGHHGNPIIFYRLKIGRGEGGQEIAEHILKSLDEVDARILYRSLDARTHKGSLFLRLDKQAAYLGELRLLESDDVIKVRIRFLPHIRGPDKIRLALGSLGLKPAEGRE